MISIKYSRTPADPAHPRFCRLAVMSLAILLSAPALADDPGVTDETYRERFDRLDRDDNGRVSRHEKSYGRADADKDGVLSDAERQARAAHRQQLDRNADGNVGPRERRYGRADTDNDGALSGSEKAVVAERRARIDRNDDGRIGRRERAYDRADHNDDGRLSRRERAYERADRNSDGYLNRREAHQRDRRAGDGR